MYNVCTRTEVVWVLLQKTPVSTLLTGSVVVGKWKISLDRTIGPDPLDPSPFLTLRNELSLPLTTSLTKLQGPVLGSVPYGTKVLKSRCPVSTSGRFAQRYTQKSVSLRNDFGHKSGCIGTYRRKMGEGIGVEGNRPDFLGQRSPGSHS